MVCELSLLYIFGIVISAPAVNIFIINIPYLTANMLHFKKGIIALP